MLFDILFLSLLLYRITDFVPKLDFEDGIELDSMTHFFEEVKILLQFCLPELGVHLVVNSVASHVLLDNLGHLVLVVLKGLWDETPTVPFFEVFLDSKRGNVAPLHPLLHLLHAYPVSKSTLDGNSSFMFLKNLSFDLQAHQQVLLRQVLYLPLRDGDAELFGVKLV